MDSDEQEILEVALKIRLLQVRLELLWVKAQYHAQRFVGWVLGI